MKTVSKAKLKAEMLAFFRQVERTGEPLIVTDHGRPVIQITALKAGPVTFEQVFGKLRGRVHLDDASIMAPTTEEWSET